jgi:hypothetical protein
MVAAPFSLREDYWESFEVEPTDLEFLYNHLLELETPLTSKELIKTLVTERIKKEKVILQTQQESGGIVYRPKDHYQTGQNLLFPQLDWQKGLVKAVRPGNNSQLPAFGVIEVVMENGSPHQFATDLADHSLNQPLKVDLSDPRLDPQFVLKEYVEDLISCLESSLLADSDLVRIADRWFPSALLVDVSVGHLNLAEAILDMGGGGPLKTKMLLEQIDLPTDVNSKLVEFSLNYRMQEDNRFDEVGPAGEVLWFLHRLEPEAVQRTPIYLQYTPINDDRVGLNPTMVALERQIDDELSDLQESYPKTNDLSIILSYPHWRAGTLPLTCRTQGLFPTAIESPRIQFTLVDADSKDKMSAWVVRPERYIYGLRDWYVSQGLIPGSIVHIRPAKTPDEVLIQVEKRRSNREWIRTVLVGADGGVVFAMLKQVVNAAFDERLAIAIPNVNAIDAIWEQNAKQKTSLDAIVFNMMRELSKLNTQGHVHAQELYASVNVLKRCPPGPIFNILATQPKYNHVGDSHYRLEEKQGEG